MLKLLVIFILEKERKNEAMEKKKTRTYSFSSIKFIYEILALNEYIECLKISTRFEFAAIFALSCWQAWKKEQFDS